MELYNYRRAYSLILGTAPVPYLMTPYDPYTPLGTVETFSQLFQNDVAFQVVQPAKAFFVNDLQIEVDIKSSLETSGQGGSATIKIYNLPEDKRKQVQRENTNIILKAGYLSTLKEGDVGQLPMIYVGQVHTSKTEWEGSERVTTLICKEGYTPATNIKISYALPPVDPLFQTYAEVFNALADIWKANGISSVNMELSTPAWDGFSAPSPLTQVVDYGWSYEGFLKDAMDDLCAMYNYVWYITNNNLYVHHKSTTEFKSFMTIDPSQILDIDEEQDASKSADKTIDKKPSRIKVKLLLDGRGNDKQMLRITAGDYKGTYVVKARAYSMSYRGQEWFTILSAEAT